MLELCLKLAIVGRDLLLDTLPAYIAGEIQPQPQDPSQVTFSKYQTRRRKTGLEQDQPSTFQPNPWDESMACCPYFP